MKLVCERKVMTGTHWIRNTANRLFYFPVRYHLKRRDTCSPRCMVAKCFSMFSLIWFSSGYVTCKWLLAILHFACLTLLSQLGVEIGRYITQRFSDVHNEEATCTRKRTENKCGSRTCHLSGANVSEEAWIGRQNLYHIISSEISTMKIPTSHNLHF